MGVVAGVESAIPDLKSSQVTVKGTYATTDLLDYVHKRTGKTAMIVKQDPEPKTEDDKLAKDEKKDGDGEKKEEKKANEGEKPADTTAKPDDAMESPVLEMRKNEYYYYQPSNFQLHPPRYAAESAYGYSPAPQMFSDENPNACSAGGTNKASNKGLAECKASASNIRRIQVRDIIKEVEDYLKTYSSAGMDTNWYANGIR
ncbi:hypothetical protein Tco_0976064 [Tanacetum coccineum]|uniref:HMA domain-containing protein n=1 Tax=Tanacetum coccineum TaxID=301880 RepID=A0ABQ5EGH2_9ASTR